ncbi:hypothetical protein FisN_7Lh320 [Fistulifera solaris]|uniref:Uncharacterized protein n=1 Tax=Fistulifera solaris TaxID=1519565 RepID=A0A1Z5JRJ6_FISSO|nr:hypothetical protein FisN_7Lh320 [Fistulifera solaris]|eukprot:GAX16589.1 hypothetical protein FisN_7Lh320 [Fistulifera solaris]
MADPPAASPMASFRPKDPSPRMFDNQGESRNPIEDSAELFTFVQKDEEFLPDDLNSLLKASGAAIAEGTKTNDRIRTKKMFSPEYKAELSAEMQLNESTPDQSKVSPFSRKAQRFSSLKKKKVSSNLLNRIFGSTGSDDSQKSADRDEDVLESSCSQINNTVCGVTCRRENRVPAEAPTEVDADPMESGCGGGFAEAVANARDNLTLYAEDEVRQAIQSSLDEVIGLAYKGNELPTPPKPQDDPKESDDYTNDLKSKEKKWKTSSEGGSVFERFVSCSSTPAGSGTSPKKQTITPGKLVIPALFTNSATKSPIPRPTENINSKSPLKVTEKSHKRAELEDVNKASTSPKHISLVGTDSGDSVSSSSISRVSSLSPPPVQTITESSIHLSPHLNYGTSPALVRIIPSREELSTVKEVSTKGSSVDEGRQDSILLIEVDDNDDEDDAAFLPDDFEAYDRQGDRELRKISSEELDQHINEALAKAEIEWNDPFGKESRSQIEYAVEDALKAAYRQFQLQEDELLFQHQQEIAKLKELHKKKLAEQKDQLALANRMAHARQIEIERLENNGESAKREKELVTLRDELKVLQKESADASENFMIQIHELQEELAETKSQLARTENELTTLDQISKGEADSLREQSAKLDTTLEELRHEKERSKEIAEQFATVSNAFSRTQKELETAIAEKEALQAQHAVIQAELIRVQKELKLTKAKLSECESVTAANISLTEQFSRISKELEESKLAQKKVEEELEERLLTVTNLQEDLRVAKKNHEDSLQELETMSKLSTKTPTRRESTGNVPNSRLYRPSPNARTPVKSPNRPATSYGTPTKRSPSVKRNSEELLEKEKESLRQQVVVLEEQILKRNEEHERALKELRTANEKEIMCIRKQYESRVEANAQKGRELKENLSVAEGSEKKELLDKIAALEAEKKANRSEGLRDVQKKEDLLQKISDLEKKEKDIIDEHERAIQTLREKNNAELLELRKTLEEQTLQFRATESELRQTISEASSYERDELLQKVESLQSQLDSERSNALLVKMKVNAAEEDATQAFEQHQLELKKLTEMMDAEIEKLKIEREAKIEIENELAELEKELEKARKDLANSKDEHQNEIVAQKEVFESRLKDIQDGHTRELDDLLSQLDLVEAEHKENIEMKEKIIREKESQIQTLSFKLDEIDLKAKAHQKIEKTWSIKLENSEKALEKSEQALVKLQEQYDTFKKEHEQFVAETEDRKEKACKAAENKVIERAEKQFKQANDLYVKLKKQYDLVKSNAERLEAELKEAKSTGETASKEKDIRLNELSKELMELKAAKESIEKEAAQKARDYRKEMQGLLKAAEEFENKFEEAEATNTSLQNALSHLESQKKKLQSEYDELHKVCDELMAHMEAQH